MNYYTNCVFGCACDTKCYFRKYVTHVTNQHMYFKVMSIDNKTVDYNFISNIKDSTIGSK